MGSVKDETQLKKDELLGKVAFRYGMSEGGLRNAKADLMRKRTQLGMKEIRPLVEQIMNSTDPEEIRAKKRELAEIKERIRTGSSKEQEEVNKWYWAVRYLDDDIIQRLKELKMFEYIFEMPAEIEAEAKEYRKRKQNNRNSKKNKKNSGKNNGKAKQEEK